MLRIERNKIMSNVGLWQDKQWIRNARSTMGNNIDRDTVGRQLTPEAKERAIDFAVDVYRESGHTSNGDAARIGIKHVTRDVLKD